MCDTHIVYVDDSGTDGKSRVAAAAFCVSTRDRWLEFEKSWQKIAKHAGFELRNFHMTDFAACRRGHPCQHCKRGQISASEHPWQSWTDEKRKNILNRMAKALVKHVECGWGQAYTKEDYDKHIRNSAARTVANEPIGDEYFTFAVQQCGGRLAEWRAANSRNDRLRFVFDNASEREKEEISKVFFAGLDEKLRNEHRVEQWFDPESGVSYESRKQTCQLLAADMLAWTIATIRARELFMKGRFVEVLWVAKVFVSSEHVKIGYMHKDTLAEWESDTLQRAGQLQEEST